MIAAKMYTAFDEISQRKTSTRRLIANNLIERACRDSDFTSKDLWQELRQVELQIGRATVYRSIEILVKRELLTQIAFADGTYHYHVCDRSEPHHHLTCIQCHRVVDIASCLSTEQVAAIENQVNFVIEGHASLFLDGVTPVERKEMVWQTFSTLSYPFMNLSFSLTSARLA